MSYLLLAFCAGVACLVHSSEPLDLRVLVLILAVSLATMFCTRLRWVATFLLGVVYASYAVSTQLNSQLDASLGAQTTAVHGRVMGIPSTDGNTQRFNLSISHTAIQSAGSIKILRLSWRDSPTQLLPGDQWELLVKIKPPHGFQNPGGFDYEKWLFQQKIDASGYVIASDSNHLVSQPLLSLDRFRMRLGYKVHGLLKDTPMSALVMALLVGDKSHIDDDQWLLLRSTGTAHLMAISGMHIGLVAAIFMLLARLIGKRLPRILLKFPLQHISAFTGLLGALGYAALAGFSMPTLRALIMLSVVLLAVILRHQLRVTLAISAAMFAIVVVDPLSMLSPGFWLSFGAVSLLVGAFSGRLAHYSRVASAFKAQWVAAFGLFPFLLLFFQQAPLIGALANMIAVPWVSVLVVPSELLGLVLLPINTQLASIAFNFSARLLEWLWMYLTYLDHLAIPNITSSKPSLGVFLSAIVGVCLLLAPRGLPLKYLGVVFLIPMFYTPLKSIEKGGFIVDVLDVGQGLSIVIRTEKHTLVYDTGPTFRSGFNTVDSVLIPYLRSVPVDSIDRLMISHGDNDHAGNVAGFIKEIPTLKFTSSDVNKFTQATACQRGQRWNWDGVEFSVLHPPEGLPYIKNDSSCVLLIQGKFHRVMVPGDISNTVEGMLASTPIDADLLIASHHGSGGSSSDVFIQAVAPKWVIFSAGYLNRFSMPVDSVINRFERYDIDAYSTAIDGMLSFHSDGHLAQPVSYRKMNRKLWFAHIDD